MANSKEFAALFRRDLTRLVQEIQAFPDGELLWQTRPGVSNSAGNLTLHLEGNLREFIGRQLGAIAFTRDRPLEFSAKGLSQADLITRIENLNASIPAVIESLEGRLGHDYPAPILGKSVSIGQALAHLNGHFNYHLGQIDILRRVLTGQGALELAQL